MPAFVIAYKLASKGKKAKVLTTTVNAVDKVTALKQFFDLRPELRLDSITPVPAAAPTALEVFAPVKRVKQKKDKSLDPKSVGGFRTWMSQQSAA